MKLRSRTFVLVLVAVGALVTWYAQARAQVATPRPDALRFQALLSEPIATPDRRSVVAGTSALLIRDRTSGDCFLAVTVGNSVGLTAARCAQ